MVIEYEHYQQMRRTYAGHINDKSHEELADTFQDLLKFRNRRIDELVRAVWGHEPLAQTAGKVCEIVADVWPMQLVLRGKMAELKGLTLDQVNAVLAQRFNEHYRAHAGTTLQDRRAESKER